MATCAHSSLPDRDNLSLLKGGDADHISREKEEVETIMRTLSLKSDDLDINAPNLTALVGTVVAAKLISTGGGLLELAKIPSRCLLIKNPAGITSTTASQLYTRLLDQAELFEGIPDPLKKRACLKYAVNSIYAARVDYRGLDPTGETGRSFREKIQKKIEKWQESEHLPVSDSKHKKKRKNHINNKWLEAKRHEHLPVSDSKPKKVKGANVPCTLYANDTDFIMKLYGKTEVELRQGTVGEVGTSSLCPPARATNIHSLPSDFDNLALSDKEAYVPELKDGDHGMKTSNINFDDLDSVSKLQRTQRFTVIMQKVEEALQKGTDTLNQGVFTEDSPESRLIADCGALAIDIQNEIVIVHYFVSKKYRLKFPELESQVIHPIYYARVVKQIANKMDVTRVDLEGLLPRDIAGPVSFTASTTSGKPLSEENLKKTIAACDRLLSLDLAKKKILEYFESRVEFFAPNISAIVGNAVAANLIWTAGGVSRLSECPFMFPVRRPQIYRVGMPPIDSPLCPGMLDETELFESTPAPLKMHVSRMISFRLLEAARLDSLREDLAGNMGRTFREEIRKKIAKWQALPLAEQQSIPILSIGWSRTAVKTMSMGEKYSRERPAVPLSRVREAFEADETMRTLSVVFQVEPPHKWDLMHTHVWFRWFTRQRMLDD